MSQTPRAGSRTTAATLALVALVLALVAGGVWWLQQEEASGGDGAGLTAERDLDEAAEKVAAQDFPAAPRVVVVSVDSLGARWVSEETTPTITALLAKGAGTLNARTERELTVTLPNHTGMVTGVRVDARHGGHGVTWNETDPRSVAPGTASVFSAIDAAGGSSAVFAGKEKFEMWDRAWPGDIDELTIRKRQRSLVTRMIHDLRRDDHDLVFLHLAGPDSAGHEHGWGSEEYVDAVAQADSDIERVVSAIIAEKALAEETVVIVTADHGGVPGATSHSEQARPENYTVPFIVWGPGVTPGDLYDLNPDYRDPGTGRPGYAGPQPVRNGAVANLVTDLLGIDPVPGSQFDAEHDLDVR